MLASILLIILIFLNALKKRKILIIGTHPPLASIVLLKIASIFKIIYKNILIIADIRDEFSISPYYNFNSNIEIKLARSIEKHIFFISDFIVFATNGYFNEYKKLYPFIKNKSLVVYTGIPSFTRKIIKEVASNKSGNDEKSIVYMGTIHGKRFPVLKRFFQCIDSVRFSFTLHFFLPYVSVKIKRFFAHFNSLNIKIHRYVDYKKALSVLSSSKLYLLIITDGSAGKRNVPYKLFDYIICGGTILVIGPDGESVKILKKHKVPYLYLGNSCEEIKRQLKVLHKKISKNKRPKKEYKELYSESTWKPFFRKIEEMIKWN